MNVNQATILITGGTGIAGYDLVRRLLPLNPLKIVIFSRNEASQVAMGRALEDKRIFFTIGDVRDRTALSKACEGADCIFHLAELNEETLCENQPGEAIKTNIGGVLNLIEAAVDNGVRKVIYWSSAQAATADTLYGLTKAIGEKLIVHANTLSSTAVFVAVRGGTIHETLPSPPSDEIRYLLPAREASRLLLKAAGIGHGGEVMVAVMPRYRTNDLRRVLPGTPASQSASAVNDDKTEILLSDYEKPESVVYDEDFLILLPAIIPALKSVYAGCKPLEGSGELPGSSLLSAAQLKDFLEE